MSIVRMKGVATSWWDMFYFKNLTTNLLPMFALIAIGVLVYGVYIPWLGFYHDDWPVIWAYTSSGTEGIASYFQGNRPMYGMFLAVFFSLFDNNAFSWHLLALLVRCASSAGLFLLFRQLFPRQSGEAWMIAVLALLYPGFTLQPMAVTYLPHQVSFFCLVLSLLFTTAALKAERGRWAWTGLGMASSLVGYLIIEYYAGLEFLRLAIIWVALNNRQSETKVSRFKRTICEWLPYLGIYFLFVYYRIFFVKTWPPSHDGMSQLTNVLNHPVRELGSRAGIGIHNIFMAIPFAWFRTLGTDVLNYRFGMSVPFSWAIGLLTTGIAVVTTEVLKRSDHGRLETGDILSGRTDLTARSFIQIGVWALLMGGLPILYSGQQVFDESNRFSDRYTLPYMLGACIVLVGILLALRLTKPVRVVAMILITFFCASFQVRNGNTFRVDWQNQKSMFWQLYWRVPDLKQGSSLFLANRPLSLPSNHSAGMLDLLYEADESNLQLDYWLFDLDMRLATNCQGNSPGKNCVASLQLNSPVMGGVRSFVFKGNTSQSLVAWNSPSGTLRVLNSKDTGESFDFPTICRSMQHISNPIEVMDENTTPRKYRPLLDILGPEPKHGWTYFYQKASLSCQKGDWHRVVVLAEEVVRRGIQPPTDNEWYPFIEGYAMAGKLDPALDLTDLIIDGHPEMVAGLSLLWETILDRKMLDPDGTRKIRKVLQDKLFLAE